MDTKGLVAIRRDNNAVAICEVTVLDGGRRETVDGKTFRARYFTEREREVMIALLQISQILSIASGTAEDEKSRMDIARILLVRAIDKITEE